MAKLRKPLIGLAIVLAILMISSIIYREIYSMEEAAPFEVNDPELTSKLLIVTQGSSFKDALVAQVIDSIKSSPIYIEVRDIAVLETTHPEDWQAILVIHTWQNLKAPELIEQFASDTQDYHHITFFATSTYGGNAIDDVDAISGASDMNLVEGYAGQIMKKLKSLLPIDLVDQNHIVH